MNSNLKSIYNVKTWIHGLAALIALVAPFVGMIPASWKPGAFFIAIYAGLQSVYASLTKAGVTVLVLCALTLGLGARSAQAHDGPPLSLKMHLRFATDLRTGKPLIVMETPTAFGKMATVYDGKAWSSAILSPPLAIPRRQALSTANIEYAFLYDFKHRESIPVASYKVSEIDGFAGRFQLEIWGYAGMNVTTQKAAAGGAVVAPWKAAKNLTLYLGVAGISEAGAKLNLLPIVGINFAPK